jgi:ABC-type Fe2+-enterobactin transport system substrate-binding protein
MNEQTSGLSDIVEPAVPVAAEAGQWPWIAATLIVVFLFIFFFLFLWKKKWPAYKAINKLHRVRKMMLAGEASRQDVLILFIQELRIGLKLPQQLPRQAPDIFLSQDQQKWPEFLLQLDRLRYETGAAPTITQLDSIATQIEVWLRRYCR